MHISQLQFPATNTPPTGSVAEVLAWVVAAVCSALCVVFWLHIRSQNARIDEKKDEIAEKNVAIGKHEVRIEGLETRIAELQEQRVVEARERADADRRRAESDKFVAGKLLDFERRDAVAVSERPGAMSDSDWGDIPTGVANAVVRRPATAQVLARPEPPPQERQPRRQIVEQYRPRQDSKRDR